MWKCWSCMQTRGCYETIPFVWHTIAFHSLGNSLDLHRTGITFMLSDTEGNRVTNFPKKPPLIQLLHSLSLFSPLVFENCWIGTLFHILLKWCQAFLTAAALIRTMICWVYANGKDMTVELTLKDGYSNHMSLAQQGKEKWNIVCPFSPV